MTVTQIINRIYKKSKHSVDACGMACVLVSVFVRTHSTPIEKFPI